MTHEELRAVAIWELRAIGLQSEWVQLLVDDHDANLQELIDAAPDLNRICEATHPWRQPYDPAKDFVFRRQPRK